MPTQQQIADHLGLDQSAVSRHLGALGLDWKAATLDEVRVAYIKHLRAVAAGHMSQDGVDLTYERAMTERVERELKLLTLAEKRGQVVNVEQLEPELSRMIGAFRTALLSRVRCLTKPTETIRPTIPEPAALTTHPSAACANGAACATTSAA